MGLDEVAALFNRGHGPTEAIWQQEEPVGKVKPVARVPTVEHREPCQSRFTHGFGNARG
jgi:hypothetical protein